MAKSHYGPYKKSSDLLSSLQNSHASEISETHEKVKHPANNANGLTISRESLIEKLGLNEQIYHDLIEPRLLYRAQNTKAFNIAFSRFVSLIFYTNNIENFLKILKSVSAKGIAETGLRKNKDTAIYHDAPHPAEVAKKVGILLSDYYNNDPQSEAIMSLIFVNLAQAAAACHDIVQNQSTPENPMINESHSAELCAKYIIDLIESELQLEIGKSIDAEDSDIVMKVIDDFKKTLPFITNELIVPTTYLVRPYNIPLAYYVNLFEEAGDAYV